MCNGPDDDGVKRRDESAASAAASASASASDIDKAYEEGKDRRYKLLFAVNGGAFAILKLAAEQPDPTADLLGSLNLWHVEVGMAVFTLAMVADIDAFGRKMRDKAKNAGETLYRWIGVTVLGLIGTLIATGWALAAIPAVWCGWIWVALLAPATILAIGQWMDHRQAKKTCTAPTQAGINTNG